MNLMNLFVWSGVTTIAIMVAIVWRGTEAE